MKRLLVLAAAAAATLFTATAANANRVNWSIGINVPPVVVSSGPAWYPAPVYYPEPAYYAPSVYSAPAYYPPLIGYVPRPRIWLPPAPYPQWFRHHDRGHQNDGRGDRGHDGRVDWRR